MAARFTDSAGACWSASAVLAVLVISGCTATTDGATTDGGTSSLTTTTGSSCTASPGMMEGPYFIDDEPNRSDIRHDDGATTADGAASSEGESGSGEDAQSDDEASESPDAEFIDNGLERSNVMMDASGTVQPGAILRLTITVNRMVGGGCSAMGGAKVDLWHANADGHYSGFAAEGTAGEDWLRGYQTTDADGKVTFTTIWPGWYPGRAVHIHVKVRDTGLEFTSQFFFDEAMSQEVYASNTAYAAKGTTPDTSNSQDGIYRQGGNKMLLLTAETDGSYIGTKTIVVT